MSQMQTSYRLLHLTLTEALVVGTKCYYFRFTGKETENRLGGLHKGTQLANGRVVCLLGTFGGVCSCFTAYTYLLGTIQEDKKTKL